MINDQITYVYEYENPSHPMRDRCITTIYCGRYNYIGHGVDKRGALDEALWLYDREVYGKATN